VHSLCSRLLLPLALSERGTSSRPGGPRGINSSDWPTIASGLLWLREGSRPCWLHYQAPVPWRLPLAATVVISG